MVDERDRRARAIDVERLVRRDDAALLGRELIAKRQRRGVLALRETLEETGWHVEPAALVGIYRWQAPETDATFIRFKRYSNVAFLDRKRSGIMSALT